MPGEYLDGNGVPVIVDWGGMYGPRLRAIGQVDVPVASDAQVILDALTVGRAGLVNAGPRCGAVSSSSTHPAVASEEIGAPCIMPGKDPSPVGRVVDHFEDA